jgi:hypothetical protein
VVVVMATPLAVPTPSPGRQYVVTDGPPPERPWQAWWLLFFDAPPPR